MKSYYASLQLGRGLAAIAVLLFHVWQMGYEKMGWNFARGWFVNGNRGVDFFFVLSGFIILHVNKRHIGIPSEAPRYFYRRVIRVYPILILLTLVKLGYMLVGGAGVPAEKKDLSYILCSTLLIPLPEFPFLAASWTLCFEMFFYSIFLLAILYGRPLRWLFAGHIVACLMFNLPWLPQLEYPASFFFSPYILDFYLGCATAHLCRNNLVSLSLARTLVVSGLVLVLGGNLFYHQLLAMMASFFTLYWGIGSFCIITGLAAWEQQKGLWVPPWLSFLGDASYSIYLVHGNILLFGGVLIASHMNLLGTHLNLTLSVLAVITLLVAILFYQFVEKPLLRWLQQKGPQRPQTPPSKLVIVAS